MEILSSGRCFLKGHSFGVKPKHRKRACSCSVLLNIFIDPKLAIVEYCILNIGLLNYLATNIGVF
jgi:hypothetical protein